MIKTAEEWLVEIDNALEYRRLYGREDKWVSLERSWQNDPGSEAAIGPNLIFGMGDSLLSDLTVPDPEFVASPEHPAGVDRAPIVEYTDNWLVRKLHMKDHVDIGLLNAFLKCRAILKIGYDSEFGYAPYYDIGTREQPAGMTLTQFDSKGRRIESTNTMPGMPWVSVVDPADFVVPWGTLFLESAPWAAHRIIRKTEYIKKDPKYKNTTRLTPQISMEDWMKSYSKTHHGKRRVSTTGNTYNANQKPEYNVLWEIRDRMTGRVIVVTPDYDKKLRDDFDALQVCGMPFVSSTFVPHTRSFWSSPLAYYLGAIQSTSFDIAKQGEKTRRINNLKFLARTGAMTSTQLTKLVSGDVGAVGFVDTSRDLKDAFMPFPQGSQMDFIIQADQVRKNAREVIGYGRNQLGEEMQSSRRTAKEVMSVERGSQKRTGRRGSAVISLYINAMNKINKIWFRYWRTPRYALVGKDWKPFTGDEIEGDYLLDLSLTNKRSVSKGQRKVESLTLGIQMMQMGVPPEAVLKYIMDASSDPAFESLLASAGQGKAPQPPKAGAQQPARGGQR